MKYFVESYGCTMNYGEGEQLSRKMEKLGHEYTDDIADADIVILNTCTVVETTEKKMISRMNDLRKSGKEVIVTGCMAKVQGNRISIRLPNSVIVPPDMYPKFSSIVENRFGHADFNSAVKHGRTAIMPIAQGCLGDCSYCITRFARGWLKSRPVEELVAELKELVSEGVKEVLVTAQDTACYGRDIGADLPTLMRALLTVEGDYRLRIGMMNPNHLYTVLDGMIDIFRDDRVYKFLHIPVQSGSDTVLKAMRRHYTTEKFFGIVYRLREAIPDISIATDIITGFPGETDEDHLESIELIEKLRADTINITRFSARPGTDAATLKNQIHGNVMHVRSKELTDVKNATEYDINSKLVGRHVKALVTEHGTEGSVIARTDNYRPIGIKENLKIGAFIDVEITGCASTYLMGRVLNN